MHIFLEIVAGRQFACMLKLVLRSSARDVVGLLSIIIVTFNLKFKLKHVKTAQIDSK